MIRARAEGTIQRSAEDVWAYAASIARHPEWMAVASAKALRGTGTDVGDRGLERMRVGPMSVNAEFTVVESIPGRRIVWRADGQSPFTGDLALDLEPSGPAATNVSYGGEFTFKGILRYLEPLFAGETRQGPAKELARLKASLESQAGRSGVGSA